ncbi:MAG TPA: alpha/beta hydrolase [Steroidobacteraceae bacterium]
MNFRILAAIIRKDVLSLAPIVALVALLYLADALIERLHLLPAWTLYKSPAMLAALVVLILSVFQTDSPASVNDDWLCRPVPKRELIAAKLALLLGTVYLPHAVGTLVADLSLGFSWAESLLDAVLVRYDPDLMLLPVLLFTAIVTRTLVQGFGVLFAIFLFLIVLPTPFVRPPSPLTPGLREELWFSGMPWLAWTPAVLTSLMLLAVGFWLMYWRRHVTAARSLMALSVSISFLFLVLPMALLPLKTIFAVQTALSPTSPADTAHIFLRSPRACFPAARRADLSTNAAFDAAWEKEALQDVGPNSIAFLTHIEARGLPLDWRVKLTYVQANYSAGGATLFSLRPAQYITDKGGGGLLTHEWMLPESAIRGLRGAQSRLELEYALSLLRPIEHLVPADGKRHALPGLGFCSAVVDEPGNRIEVDCFSAFTRTAQISAELIDIPASRVYGSADFAPTSVKWLFGKHVRLDIGSPRLARHDSIKITSWEATNYFAKSLTLPGILGADLETCPLPSSERDGFQKASWRDAAPHEASSIRVDEGVQLEVLDFGGTGSPILLLPGLGATAHSYDELAPLLAKKHRVFAMTRRGTGYSSKPDFGFDTARLGQDVLQVMDALSLPKVLLVGHSIAGDELTWLGGKHPERFSALVYLDAAYDRSGDPKSPDALRLRELNRTLPPEPPRPPQAMLSFDAMTKMLLERGHVRIPEGELISLHRVNDPLFAGTPSIEPRTQQAISAAIQAPDYAAVKIPALAVYAIEDPHKPLPPWYDPNDKELAANLAERARLVDAMKRESIELFRRGVEKGQVLELTNASHYLIQSNQQEVLSAIEQFVAGLGL